MNFDMPEIKTPSDALVAATAIMRAVAGGELTPIGSGRAEQDNR